MKNPDRKHGQANEVCGAIRKPRDGDEPGKTYYCMLAAGHGTTHQGWGPCKFHFGATPSVQQGYEKHLRELQEERAYEAVRTFGLPVDISPTEALIQEVHRTAGAVAYLETVVSELTPEQLYQHDDVGGHGTKRVPSVWVTIYQAERSHLVRVAAEAIKCGVAERQVRVAEQQGLMLAGALRSILTRLGVLEHPDAPTVVREELLRLSSASANVSSSLPTSSRSTTTRALSAGSS